MPIISPRVSGLRLPGVENKRRQPCNKPDEFYESGDDAEDNSDHVYKIDKFHKFMALPPEIRNAIYELLIPFNHAIYTTSPIKRRKGKKQQFMTPFGNLLFVNKFISAEVKSIFWSTTIAVCGNGWHGSTYKPNLHGFKNFICRVPPPYIARIQCLELRLNVELLTGQVYKPFFRKSDAKDLHYLTRCIEKYFTGLRHLVFRTPLQRRYCKVGNTLENSDLTGETVKAIRRITQLNNILTVRFEDTLAPYQSKNWSMVDMGWKAMAREKGDERSSVVKYVCGKINVIYACRELLQSEIDEYCERWGYSGDSMVKKT